MAMSDELGKLGELHQRGVLSDDEFARAKSRVLGGEPVARSDGPELAALNALRRSRRDSWFGGVCGGIAVVTGVESWVWRLLFGALLLCAGTGFVLYLLMWIVVPLEAQPSGSYSEVRAG